MLRRVACSRVNTPAVVSSALRACLPVQSRWSTTTNPNATNSAGAAADAPVVERLPRYPAMHTLGVVRGLDYMGTVSFAISGSMTAATCGLDMLGCTVIGSITALGGGTVRDMMWGALPVFWLEEREYLYMAAVTAWLTFCCCTFMDLNDMPGFESIMFWTDTVGLGAFAVIGAMWGIRHGYKTFVVLVCTLITCTGGGLIRDTFCRRPARVFHPFQETYAITTICGGAVFIGLKALGTPLCLRVPAAAGTVIGLRYAAVQTDFKLPHAEYLMNKLKLYHAPHSAVAAVSAAKAAAVTADVKA